MEYRRLGRTDMKVSAISFGAWAIGGTWGPVDDEESMRALLSQGFTRFIELGPGKALSGFLKRIDPAAQALSVSNVAGLAETAGLLGD